MEIKQDSTNIWRNPAALLQKLIRFDTTNPPGNEAECVTFINHILTQAGITTKVLARSPDRPNLIARLPGRGASAPLLLYGHVDVVTTENQQWRHPPFAGAEAEGFIWGRGALDMKGGVAMMLAAFLRARAEKLKPPGDIILAVVSDEETGGDHGAGFLVENHPREFDGVRYAIGEFGGFTMTVGGRRFYPIQIAEKQICWLNVTFCGPAGHGSLPVRGGAMSKLSRFLQQLDKHELPVHITPPAHLMINSIASALGGISGTIFAQILNPRLTDRMIRLMGERGRMISPLLHHTVSPTILHGSSKINVIPGRVSVELDGRLLPGFRPEDLIRELRRMVCDDAEIEVIRYDLGPAEPDLGMFDTLAGILKEADSGAVPIPMLLSGVTDGRYFARLGIQTYGFLPMPLPGNFNFTKTIHGPDERIPVDAVEFGANAIYQVLQRFRG